MNISPGLLALMFFFSMIILLILPIIFLRRLWNSNTLSRQHLRKSAPEQIGKVFPRAIPVLALVNIGLILLLFWTLAFNSAYQQNDYGQITQLLWVALPINLPWLLALFNCWKKGVFKNEF